MLAGFINYVVVKSPEKIRNMILNKGGVHTGANFHGLKDAYFDYYPTNLFIGNDTFINRHNQFHIGFTRAKIEIGNNCDIGPNVTFMCVNHKISGASRRAGEEMHNDIIVEDGTWIGANCIILPGTIIRKGCVIAAGSVVRGILDCNGLYAGVPAKLIRVL